jgi:hypothetical protein
MLSIDFPLDAERRTLEDGVMLKNVSRRTRSQATSTYEFGYSQVRRIGTGILNEGKHPHTCLSH